MSIHGSMLVVDDVNNVGELVEAAAGSLGLRWQATTNTSALTKLLTPETKLILLDPMIPRVDVIQVLRVLSERHRDASIVLLDSDSNRVLESTERLASTYGLNVAGHLRKPFSPSELQSLIREYAGLLENEQLPRDRERAGDADLLDVQRAIEQDEFVLHYQPQIEITSGRVIGLEAFARWKHPEFGLTFPEIFIAEIRARGLLVEFDRLVLNRGLAELSQFAQAEGRPLRLTLKVSPDSLRDPEFPEALAAIAKRYRVLAQWCAIEVAESWPAEEQGSMAETLRQIRMRDFSLSVDDYGMGWVDVKHLRESAATELKIDRAFVQNVFSNDRDRTMVEKVILVGHELGMTVLADGVETQQQLDFLRERGCDFAQGYLISHPLHPERLTAWLKGYRGDR